MDVRKPHWKGHCFGIDLIFALFFRSRTGTLSWHFFRQAIADKIHFYALFEDFHFNEIGNLQMPIKCEGDDESESEGEGEGWKLEYLSIWWSRRFVCIPAIRSPISNLEIMAGHVKYYFARYKNGFSCSKAIRLIANCWSMISRLNSPSTNKKHGHYPLLKMSWMSDWFV